MNTSELNPTAASLLGFLHQSPMTGWELAQAVDNSIGQFWNVTRSQIYRELKTLDRLGLVQMGKSGARERRPYTISEAGRLAFSGWISREPGPELIRFPLLLTIFFGEHVEPSRLDRFLRIHRLEHERRLEQYRQFDEALAGTSTSRRNTVRFGILYEEAVLAWFDSLPKLDALKTVTRAGHRSPKGLHAVAVKPDRPRPKAKR
jgi:DNA-binding PadR family transcriptional regulator